MSKHLRLVAVVVLISLMALSACAKPAAVGESSQPTPTPVKDKASEKQWSYTDASSPDNLDSYRLKSVTTLKEEGSQPATVELLVEHDRKDAAEHVVVMNDDPSAAAGKVTAMEVIRVGDANYAKTGDSDWITLQMPYTDVLPSVGLMYQPETILGAAEGKYAGAEKVNGVDAEHYVYDRGAMAQTGQFESIVNSDGEVWVSTQYNVVVRSIIHIEGKDSSTGKLVTVDVQSDMTDINTDILIKAPEGVEQVEAPTDIPVMPGASNVVTMMGMTRFDVKATAAQVTDYYKAEMVNAGWKEAASVAPGFLTYQKTKRTASIAIQSQGDQVGVAIIVQEGE